MTSQCVCGSSPCFVLFVLALGLPATALASAADDQCHAVITFSDNVDGSHSWGLTWSFEKLETAQARAVAECWNSGGTNCNLVGAFRNACIEKPDGGSIGFDGIGKVGTDDSRAAEVADDALTAGEADVDVWQDCPDCPRMVEIPSGSFRMGCLSGDSDCANDELPVHEVRIAQPFALSVTEVTFAQWDACASLGGCDGYWPLDEGWGRGDQPVVNVSWRDAQNYVAWLSAKTGQQYRLPTESEWEYAARAGSTTKYSWGDRIGENRANCGGCGSAWNDRRFSAPVGSFNPNAWGLHDMHGNVWEWVQDVYRIGYDRAPSDGGPVVVGENSDAEPVHVLRGGSWISSPKYLRSAYRFRYAPDSRYFIAGFRVARKLDS